jgi:3-methyladenine DNA glycosylase AlkC
MDDFTPAERRAAQRIYAAWAGGDMPRALHKLRALKAEVYAAIPARQRVSRGVTWVLQRLSALLAQTCAELERKQLALALQQHLGPADDLLGVSIFLMGAYGQARPAEVLEFFEGAASSPHWVVRELAAAGFRPVIGPNRDAVRPWLKKMALASDPNRRRLVSETLRPVTVNRWLLAAPDYSLDLLRLLFREPHSYPRTSVGNNLSDLSRRQPELIFAVVDELMALSDPNSAWIACRACRNLVKTQPARVLSALRVEAYHYKDRHVSRAEL